MAKPLAYPLPHLLYADRFAAARDAPWHTHEGAELVLIGSGACECRAGNVVLPGKPGNVWVLPARVPQFQRTMRFTRTSYAVFEVAPERFDTSPRVLQVGMGSAVARWIDDLCDLHRSPGHSFSGAADALLLAIVEALKSVESQTAAMADVHPSLAMAVQRLAERLTDTIQVSDLADIAGLSQSHLTALFRERFGCGPIAYQHQLRMQRAEKMLLAPYLTVKEVARACGYEDANYFTRAFRISRGISPRKWRDREGVNLT